MNERENVPHSGLYNDPYVFDGHLFFSGKIEEADSCMLNYFIGGELYIIDGFLHHEGTMCDCENLHIYPSVRVDWINEIKNGENYMWEYETYGIPYAEIKTQDEERCLVGVVMEYADICNYKDADNLKENNERFRGKIFSSISEAKETDADDGLPF